MAVDSNCGTVGALIAAAISDASPCITAIVTNKPDIPSEYVLGQLTWAEIRSLVVMVIADYVRLSGK
jgi:hypothetical protein